MKIKPLVLIISVALLMMSSAPVIYSQSMDELIDSLDREYEAITPPPNSSVNADYKLSQVALGSLYTTKALNLLYRQNQEISEKYDVLIERYDKMIDQNEEIIQLLTVISEKEEKPGTNEGISGN